jgi:hypothetical protein
VQVVVRLADACRTAGSRHPAVRAAPRPRTSRSVGAGVQVRRRRSGICSRPCPSSAARRADSARGRASGSRRSPRCARTTPTSSRNSSSAVASSRRAHGTYRGNPRSCGCLAHVHADQLPQHEMRRQLRFQGLLPAVDAQKCTGQSAAGRAVAQGLAGSRMRRTSWGSSSAVTQGERQRHSRPLAHVLVDGARDAGDRRLSAVAAVLPFGEDDHHVGLAALEVDDAAVVGHRGHLPGLVRDTRLRRAGLRGCRCGSAACGGSRASGRTRLGDGASLLDQAERSGEPVGRDAVVDAGSHADSSSTPRRRSMPRGGSADRASLTDVVRRRRCRAAGSSRGCCSSRSCAPPAHAPSSSCRGPHALRRSRRGSIARGTAPSTMLRKRLRTCTREYGSSRTLLDGIEYAEQHGHLDGARGVEPAVAVRHHAVRCSKSYAVIARALTPASAPIRRIRSRNTASCILSVRGWSVRERGKFAATPSRALAAAGNMRLFDRGGIEPMRRFILTDAVVLACSDDGTGPRMPPAGELRAVVIATTWNRPSISRLPRAMRGCSSSSRPVLSGS